MLVETEHMTPITRLQKELTQTVRELSEKAVSKLTGNSQK
jgi:hypothetical protein